MGFWLFMTVSDLLIPTVMVIFGLKYRKAPPKSINQIFGYRTKRSMRNPKTWAFAHRHFGTLWAITGAVLLPVSIGWMVLLLNAPEPRISMMGLILCGIQLVILLFSLFPTETALKKKFGK